jgi:protein-disulfide isomerase
MAAGVDDAKPIPAGLHVAILLSAFAGLFAAAVLGVGHVLDLPVPCGGSRGCASVAAHPSSKLFGVPIAFIGMAAYLVYLGLMGRPVIGRRARLAAVVLAGAGTAISASLLVYSQMVIRATCPWCVASGVAMTALLVLGLFIVKPAAPVRGVRPAVVWTLGLITAAAIGVQAGRMERAASAPPVPAERLAKLGVPELVDPVKSIGPADAPVTVVIFADFWCPACRGALTSLLQYRKAHPQAVRVVYRHQPLWQIRGHETSKAAAALSEMAGEQGKFWAFADAVHTHRRQLTRQQYLELMQTLGFDPAAVEARLGAASDPALANVERDIALAERLGIHATPTFILKVGTYPAVSASQRGLARLLNSPVVTSILAERKASIEKR